MNAAEAPAIPLKKRRVKMRLTAHTQTQNLPTTRKSHWRRPAAWFDTERRDWVANSAIPGAATCGLDSTAVCHTDLRRTLRNTAAILQKFKFEQTHEVECRMQRETAASQFQYVNRAIAAVMCL